MRHTCFEYVSVSHTGAFVVSDLGDLCLLWVSSPFLQAGFFDGLRIKLNLGNFHDTSQHVHVASSAVLESKCRYLTAGAQCETTCPDGCFLSPFGGR